MDVVKEDLKSVNDREEDAEERVTWKQVMWNKKKLMGKKKNRIKSKVTLLCR